MAHDVFVSYAAGNKPTADAAVAALEGAGVRCWIAPRDVTPGSNYMGSISKAIRAAEVLVLVFSEAATESPHVRREVQQAAEQGKAILPLKIEEAVPGDNLSYALVGTHWLDAMSEPLEEHLNVLVGTVQLLTGRTAAPELPSPSDINNAVATPPVASNAPSASVPDSDVSEPARQRSRRWARRISWVLWPLLSGGILAFVPYVWAALRRTTRLWISMAVAVPALTIVAFLLFEDTDDWRGWIPVWFWLGTSITSWFVGGVWERRGRDSHEAPSGTPA